MLPESRQAGEDFLEGQSEEGHGPHDVLEAYLLAGLLDLLRHVVCGAHPDDVMP